MKATSRAAVLYGPGELRIEELPLPEVGRDDGLLKVEATGVCGTDMAAYHGVNPFYELPCALGHEFVGSVADIGPAARARWNAAFTSESSEGKHNDPSHLPVEGLRRQRPGQGHRSADPAVDPDPVTAELGDRQAPGRPR